MHEGSKRHEGGIMDEKAKRLCETPRFFEFFHVFHVFHDFMFSCLKKLWM